MNKIDNTTALGSAVPPAAAARTERPNEGGTADGDAPPTNRASHNCNNGECQPLRWGVDSLYLSYAGDLHLDVHQRLDRLKKLAQSADADEQGKAQYAIGDHCFEVKDKGSKLFPYVLEDGHYRIQFSRPGKKLPMAYVKLSSGLLAHTSPAEIETHLGGLLEHFGALTSTAQVSRIDLFFDFATTESMEWDRQSWVGRSGDVTSHSVSHQFTGWSIGMGGNIGGRLYNKVLEIIKSGKDYLLPLWQAAGWQPPALVWRMEFEFKREVLNQFGLANLSTCLQHLDGLWSYATTEWLKLTLPSESDKTRSRWPVHPLWEAISSVDWASSGGPLLREYPAARIPGDDKLMSLYLSLLISYMAREKVSDLFDGHQAFTAAMYDYHAGKALNLGLSFDDYIAEKLALKTRAFNTILNCPDEDEVAKADQLANEAKAYRRAKDGN